MDKDEQWIMIYSYREKPESLDDYYVATDGCGCCQDTKSPPDKKDLDLLEKNLNEMLETICYLKEKYNMK